MRNKLALSIAVVALVAVIAFWAIPQGVQSEAGVTCTLTGKTVDKCCCETRDGKIYCPLADKTLEECCCVAAEGGTKQS
jgi:hypothetical protein